MWPNQSGYSHMNRQRCSDGRAVSPSLYEYCASRATHDHYGAHRISPINGHIGTVPDPRSCQAYAADPSLQSTSFCGTGDASGKSGSGSATNSGDSEGRDSGSGEDPDYRTPPARDVPAPGSLMSALFSGKDGVMSSIHTTGAGEFGEPMKIVVRDEIGKLSSPQHVHASSCLRDWGSQQEAVNWKDQEESGQFRDALSQAFRDLLDEPEYTHPAAALQQFARCSHWLAQHASDESSAIGAGVRPGLLPANPMSLAEEHQRQQMQAASTSQAAFAAAIAAATASHSGRAVNEAGNGPISSHQNAVPLRGNIGATQKQWGTAASLGILPGHDGSHERGKQDRSFFQEAMTHSSRERHSRAPPSGEQVSSKRKGKSAPSRSIPPEVMPEKGAAQLDMQTDSLRLNLEQLRDIDENRIFIARKINQLGFESGKVLETYFGQFGAVERVLVAHCHTKSRSLQCRPAGLGFVVMADVQSAQSILSHSREHLVPPIDGRSSDKVMVSLFPFKHRGEEQ